MPLTKIGKKVLRRFEGEYKHNGKSMFYAYMKAHPSAVKRFHIKK